MVSVIFLRHRPSYTDLASSPNVVNVSGILLVKDAGTTSPSSLIPTDSVKGALHEMVVPALLAIIVPLATGLILGPTGVVGLLGGVSVTGFAMAVFMSNAGGAWDNAKKYIEGGHHGGKGSECHKAAVVGDTVGDPFKDTSGPSLNILIKLCSTVSIVFSGLILAFNLMNWL